MRIPRKKDVTMPRKKKIEANIIEVELKNETKEEIEEPILKIEEPKKKLKEHIVLSWNSSKVYFEVAGGNICFTDNIWGSKLVPGDTIYLEE
jgi:hypothetical protein